MPEDALPIYAIRFTPRARADIDGAYDRFAEISGEEVADAWMAGLFDTAATLATLPRRHQVAEESKRFRQEVRQVVYRRRPHAVAYRLLFTIVEAPDDAPVIRILHVRHGAARPLTQAEAQTLEAEE